MNDLIRKIQEYTLQIDKRGAKEEAKMFNEYIVKLTNKAQANDTLKEFFKFTQHYKGMRDMIVPHYSEKEWFEITRNLGKYSKQAMIEQGLLKKGIFKKILDFFF